MNHYRFCLAFALLAAQVSFAQVSPSTFTEDTTRAQRYFKQALKLTKAAEYDSANFYFEHTRQIYERYALQRQDSTFWQIDVLCYNMIGDNLRVKGEFKSALAVLQRNLELALKKIGEQQPYVADIYNNLGAVYGELADYDRAIVFHNKSLALSRQLYGEEHASVARSYNNLANAIGDKGDLEKANELYAKALNLRRKLYGDEHPRVATTYLNMGTVYVLEGDYDQALACFNRAWAIWQKKLGANHPNSALAQLNMGLVYYQQGNYAEALAHHNQALEIYQQVSGENSFDAGDCYGNIGSVYLELGNYRDAIDFFNRSLTILRNEVGENHPTTTVRYNNLGETYYRQGDYEQALVFHQKDLAIQLKLHGERHWDVARAYQELGKTYRAKHDLAQAFAHYQKALAALVPGFNGSDIYLNPPLTKSLSNVFLLSTLTLKAEAFAELYTRETQALKDLQMSLSTCRLAADLIDRIRRSYESEGSKLFLGKNGAQVYERAIRTALQIYDRKPEPQYLRTAFTFAEKGKAGVLAEALQASQAKNFSGIPPAMQQKEKALRVDLAFYETAIQKEKLKTGKRDEERLRDFESRYFARTREYEQLVARLEKSYPKYYALKYKAQTVSPAEVQAALDDQTAALEYFLGDSSIYAFVLTKAEVKIHVIRKDSSFHQLVIALVGSLKNVTSRAAYLRSAAQLYRILIKPIEPLCEEKRRWIIIPDGELHQIPFEALLTETISPQADADYRTLPYLIKQHEISYHYSATLFLKSLKENSAGSYASLFAGFAPVFAAAAKNGVIYRGAPEDSSVISPVDSSFLATRDGKTLEPLLYSAQEVQDILAAFPNRSRAFLQQEASEENFKQQIKGYKYVHIATHGRIVDQIPKLSNLTFSQPQDNKAKEDGILYSAETYNLDLTADLLVLSACQTGAGQIVKGEGLMGLTRGFLYSGARNIVASLWKVYDQHTSLLMVEMYRQIAAGKSYSAALREAKLKMIANPETAAPQSWAGFVLIGR